MPFEDVYLVSDKLILTPAAELDELENWLGGPLPRGYREYMTTLGDGTYCDRIWILTPNRVREVVNEQREHVRKYYREFWGGNEEILPFEEAIRGVCFARTWDGDHYLYCHELGKRLFVPPRHDDAVYWLEMGFEDPLDWRSLSGRRDYVYEPPFRYFEPGGPDRRIIEFFTAGAFEMRDLAQRFRAKWSGQEVRSIPEPESIVLFPRALGGRIQLTQAPEERRVGIRLDYDNDCCTEIEQFANELRDMGFYETWRHPCRNVR